MIATKNVDQVTAGQERQTGRTIWFGFGALLGLFVLLLALAMSELQQNRRVLHIVEKGLEHSALVQEMHAAARQRSILLMALVNESDPFLRDEQLLQYDALGGRFGAARHKLVALGLDSTERSLLERQRANVAKVQAVQRAVIEAALRNDLGQAQSQLMRAAIPAQDVMLGKLSAMSDHVNKRARAEASTAQHTYERTREMVWLGGVLTVLCGIGVAAWVQRHLLGLMREREGLTQVLHETLRDLNFQKQAMDEHAIVSIADADGNIIYVNDKFIQISGYYKSELIGKNHRLLESGTQPPAMLVDMWSVIAKGHVWQGEVCNRAKNGSLYWVNTTIVPFLNVNGLPTQYVSVRTDITQTKANEVALSKAKQELERRVAERTAELREQLHFSTELMEALPNPMFYNNAQGYCLGVNRAWEELFGVPRAQIVGKPMNSLCQLVPDTAADQALWQNPGKQVYEIAIPTAHGELRDVLFYKATFTSALGRAGGLVGSIVDISIRKRMEQQLTAAKQALEDDIAARIEAERALSQFKLTLDQTHDCVFMFDPDTFKFSYVNRGAMAQVGFTYEALIDMTPLDIGPDFNAATLHALVRPLLDGSLPMLTFETRHRHQDGHLIPVQIVLQYVQIEGARRFVAIVRDVAERQRSEAEMQARNRQLEETNRQLHEAQHQLLQSEKMASVGQLAAGVAHEINNPIGYVFSNLGSLDIYLKEMLVVLDAYEEAESVIADVEVLERIREAKASADLVFVKKDVKSLMDECKEGITRVKKIVQDLKDFSRVDNSDDWLWADLHQGLDSTLNIVRNELKYKAEIVKDYGILPEVECLPSQLNQVFLNLLVNAGHAIEERGTITLRTGTQDCGAEGGQVWVEIADSGKGIAPEHLQRIFDPFFTTKPVGTGTGLGLSLSYSIVQKHDGRIEVQSEVGQGTRFRIWLPIRRTAALALEEHAHA